jgi:hypothetical protein
LLNTKWFTLHVDQVIAPEAVITGGGGMGGSPLCSGQNPAKPQEQSASTARAGKRFEESVRYDCRLAKPNPRHMP